MCISAASERHDDIPEREMHAGASGGIYPLLDPQSKNEVRTETELCKVAESEVTPLTRNWFGAVVDDKRELRENKGACILNLLLLICYRCMYT